MFINHSFTRQCYERNHEHSVYAVVREGAQQANFLYMQSLSCGQLNAQCCSLITPSAGKMDDTANEREMHNMTPKAPGSPVNKH